MKHIGIKLIAAFEILFGLVGLNAVLGALFGRLPSGVLPVQWYGLFPLMSLCAGVLLLLRWKHSVNFSFLVLLLQVPFIRTDDFFLNLGAPLNFTISGTWISQHGGGPTVLGINFLALAFFIALLWCRSDLQPAVVMSVDSINTEPQQEAAPDV